MKTYVGKIDGEAVLASAPTDLTIHRRLRFLLGFEAGRTVMTTIREIADHGS
jgi:hypothetical protein